MTLRLTLLFPFTCTATRKSSFQYRCIRTLRCGRLKGDPRCEERSSREVVSEVIFLTGRWSGPVRKRRHSSYRPRQMLRLILVVMVGWLGGWGGRDH